MMVLNDTMRMSPTQPQWHPTSKNLTQEIKHQRIQSMSLGAVVWRRWN